MRAGQVGRRQAVEAAALPLADGPGVLAHIALEFELADHGVELAAAQFLGHRRAVQRADAFDRLLQHFQRRVLHRAGPGVWFAAVVGFLVRLDVVLDLRRGHVPAAGAHHALDGRRRELVAIDREGAADADVEDLGIEAGDLRLLGEAEGVGRVAEGDEGVRAEALDLVHDRREVLRAQRIGFVIDHVEAGGLERRAGAGHHVEAVAVGDVHHRHLLADLAFGVHFLQQIDQAAGHVLAAAQQPETVGPALGKFRPLVGDRGDGDLRIAVLGEHRRRGQVGARAPGGDDEVGLVLRGQALDGLDCVVIAGAVVVLDQFHRHALVAGGLEQDTAALVDLGYPELDVGPVRDAGAAGAGAGLGRRRADLDGLDFLGVDESRRHECRGHRQCPDKVLAHLSLSSFCRRRRATCRGRLGCVLPVAGSPLRAVLATWANFRLESNRQQCHISGISERNLVKRGSREGMAAGARWQPFLPGGLGSGAVPDLLAQAGTFALNENWRLVI